MSVVINKKNEFTVQGLVHSISEPKSNQSNTFSWREIVLETMGSKYNDYILFQAVDDDVMKSLNKYREGELVTVRFKISGRKIEKDGEFRIYNNNKILNINKTIR